MFGVYMPADLLTVELDQTFLGFAAANEANRAMRRIRCCIKREVVEERATYVRTQQVVASVVVVSFENLMKLPRSVCGGGGTNL